MRNQKFGLETLRNFICGVTIDPQALAPSGLTCLTPFGVMPIGITSESLEPCLLRHLALR